MKTFAVAAAGILGAGIGAGMFVLAAGAALADSYPAVELFKGGETVTGEVIAYPTTGKPVVTAAIVTIGPGEKTVVHRHGVPLFIHVLEGEVTVDYGDRGTKRFKAGESFLEAMNVEHAGTNVGTVPVKMLAVYMGAEGAADVVPRE